MIFMKKRFDFHKNCAFTHIICCTSRQVWAQWVTFPKCFSKNIKLCLCNVMIRVRGKHYKCCAFLSLMFYQGTCSGVCQSESRMTHAHTDSIRFSMLCRYLLNGTDFSAHFIFHLWLMYNVCAVNLWRLNSGTLTRLKYMQTPVNCFSSTAFKWLLKVWLLPVEVMHIWWRKSDAPAQWYMMGLIKYGTFIFSGLTLFWFNPCEFFKIV